MNSPEEGMNIFTEHMMLEILLQQLIIQSKEGGPVLQKMRKLIDKSGKYDNKGLWYQCDGRL